MRRLSWRCVTGCLMLAIPAPAAFAAEPAWRIHVTHDNCPDYTWGFTEAQTRQAFADIVRAHLDEMKRTDDQPPENRDHYNMAVTQEALCFVERYPERKAELIARIREGRVFVSPFLCNSLWGFQSTESAIRTLYPARRLEREWGVGPFDVAEHIELPSLPWGTASILSGCGVKWLSIAFLNYDCTFGGLNTPPLFALQGPDGAELRVVMDAWASNRANYTQGAQLLQKPEANAAEWVRHFQEMGNAYPWRVALAGGTHGDISPSSGAQARGFNDALIRYNAGPGRAAVLLNSTLARFCREVDEQSAGLPAFRGCFGHSWELWPVSLAKYAADMREGERRFLAAEALLAIACLEKPDLAAATRRDRERAEWCLAMLSDHAWNGTDENNQRENARLRREWSQELLHRSADLTRRGWAALGVRPAANRAVLFNSLSVPRAGLVRLEGLSRAGRVLVDGRPVPHQVLREQGGDEVCFVSPTVEGYATAQVRVEDGPAAPSAEGGARLLASPTELASPFYRLKLDPATGGISSLIHVPSGREMLSEAGGKRRLLQTVYFDGREHTLSNVRCEATVLGPVLARLQVRGEMAGIEVATHVTLYAELDQVDFETRIRKPASTQEQRLCHLLPVLADGRTLRADTTGAVIRPAHQPRGDLLPGADARRLAVQGFVDVSDADGPGLTVAPLDAFALRLDGDVPAFEALGNDQNFKEVSRAQGGEKEFRFRYVLRVHAAGYDNAAAVAWSRAVATPLLTMPGEGASRREAPAKVDPARAVALCLKPADDASAGGLVLRVWETGGRGGPVSLRAAGMRRAVRTDLLERDLRDLPIRNGGVEVHLPAHGFAAVRFIP